jgi:hypothetical protein
MQKANKVGMKSQLLYPLVRKVWEVKTNIITPAALEE